MFALKECDEAVKMIAEFAKPLQTYDLKSQLNGSRDYANNQQELTKLAKEMVLFTLEIPTTHRSVLFLVWSPLLKSSQLKWETMPRK